MTIRNILNCLTKNIRPKISGNILINKTHLTIVFFSTKFNALWSNFHMYFPDFYCNYQCLAILFGMNVSSSDVGFTDLITHTHTHTHTTRYSWVPHNKITSLDAGKSVEKREVSDAINRSVSQLSWFKRQLVIFIKLKYIDPGS